MIYCSKSLVIFGGDLSILKHLCSDRIPEMGLVGQLMILNDGDSES